MLRRNLLLAAASVAVWTGCASAQGQPTLEEDAAAFGTRDLTIDGNDVMRRVGLPPGPWVGKVLEELLQRVLEQPELNQREALLQATDEVAKKLAPPR